MKLIDLEYKAILGFRNCKVRLSKIVYSEHHHQDQDDSYFVKSDYNEELDCESFEQDSVDHQSFTSASSSSASSRRSSTSYPCSNSVLSHEQTCKECRVDVKKLAPSIVHRLCSSSSSSIVSRSKVTTPTARKRIRLEIQREPGSREDADNLENADSSHSSLKRTKFCEETLLSNYGLKNCFVKVLKLRSKEKENQAKENATETSCGQESNGNETNLEFLGIPDLDLVFDSDDESVAILIESDTQCPKRQNLASTSRGAAARRF